MFMNNRRMISPAAPIAQDPWQRRMRQRAATAMEAGPAGQPVGQLSPGLPEGAPIQQQTLPTAMRNQQAALEAMRQQQAMPPPPLPLGGSLPPELLQKPAMTPPLPPGGLPNPMIPLMPPSQPEMYAAEGKNLLADQLRRQQLAEQQKQMQQQMLQRGAAPAPAPGSFPGAGRRFMGMWGR